MILFYERFENNELLHLLQNNEIICKTLVYMVSFQEQENLKVVAKKHSIEIFNEKISVSIVLFVGFENEEIFEISQKLNYHIISFSKFTKEMFEFSTFKNQIKFINSKAWFFTSLSFLDNEFYDNLKTILEL